MKLKSKVRSLVATTLLFAGASSFAATLDYTIGLGGDQTFAEAFGPYVESATIKVTADGSATTTVSAGLAAALTTAGVNGGPDGSSATEVAVVGFQANGNDYFAIIQIDGSDDGVAKNISYNSGTKLGVAGTTINALGESLTFQVTDILKADGTSVTADGVTISNAFKFNGTGIGNATSSEKQAMQFYINSSVGSTDDTNYNDIDGDELFAFMGDAPDWGTTPVRTFKMRNWQKPGSTNPANVTYSFFGIQFDTDGMIPSAGDTELDNVSQFDAVDLGSGGTTDALTYADWSAVEAALPAALKVSGVDAINVSWANDSYDGTAETYTFVGTIGDTLETGFVDDQDPRVRSSLADPDLTVTATLTVANPTEITGYDAVAAPFAGSIQHQIFADEAAVATALGTQLTATEDDALVDVTWASSPTFDPAVAGTYTFTATVTDTPDGYVDNEANDPANVTVDVVVTKADFVTSETFLQSTLVSAFQDISFQTFFPGLAGTQNVTGTIYIVLEDGTANEALYEIDLKLSAEETNETPTLEYSNGRITVNGPAGNANNINAGQSVRFDVVEVRKGGIASTEPFGFSSVDCGNNADGEPVTWTTDEGNSTQDTGDIDFSTATGISGLPTSFIKATQDSGSSTINSFTFDFNSDALTPALGVDVEQTGTLVEWTIDEEINVKGYKLVKKGTTEVVAFVEYDSAKDGQYVLDLVDYDGLVDLIVVDNDGKESNPYSPENGNEVTGNYNLVEGWNLISVPGDNADLSAVEAATVGTLWGWDGSKYVETDGQTAYEGIWVYATETAAVTATATKAATTLDIEAGWTLAGPGNTVEVPENVTVFGWDGTYSPTLSIDMGVGYWFFTPEATTITLDID